MTRSPGLGKRRFLIEQGMRKYVNGYGVLSSTRNLCNKYRKNY